ncbi:hypothetical protein QEV83_02640 [Methylocapsa sp. D3K7]|uniref:hypothetical protein n=1 Tax=Methylocapsa sp. D3K7 TaxID=3041435 RepID=UPI00244E8E42|nr:hypothetical protein [Methylocapsa sp. D3K7]WGJ15217.1 hypothetical protein QEV83_02640 [Methylocapsa sp. D3K7]
MRKLSGLAIFAVGFVAWHAFDLGRGEARADGSSALRYHYVSLDEALPPGFLFFDPIALTNDDRVYLTVWACDVNCVPSVAVYKNGKTSVIHPGVTYAANNGGTIGGSVITDIDNFIEQAALFTQGRPVEVIPRLSGESTSHVARISDSGIALVQSDSATSISTFYLYKHGTVTPLNLGTNPAGFVSLNNRGLVAGRIDEPGPNDRAFRYDPRSGVVNLLNPLPSEPESWGQAINSRGDVLGYSFKVGALERIGVWRDKTFKTYFVEGTPAFPTVSNQLLWNEPGLIVITRTSLPDLNSYVVPKPDVRVKLADITDTLPIWTAMLDINDHGDILGLGGSSYFNIEHTFLLKRVDGDAAAPKTAPQSLSASHVVMPQRRQCPQKIPSPLSKWCRE